MPALASSSFDGGGLRIPVEGGVLLLDAADASYLLKHSWSVRARRNSYYVVGRANSRTEYLHRLLMGAGAHDIVDHVNRDTLDNRRANLRFCTPAGNAANAVHPLGETGYRGVRKKGYRHRGWSAAISVAGKTVCLGTFADPVDAAQAYDAAARRYHGEFAVLNFPGRG